MSYYIVYFLRKERRIRDTRIGKNKLQKGLQNGLFWGYFSNRILKKNKSPMVPVHTSASRYEKPNGQKPTSIEVGRVSGEDKLSGLFH